MMCVFLFVSLGADENVFGDGVKEKGGFCYAMCLLWDTLSSKRLVMSNETVSSTCRIEASKHLCCCEDTTQSRDFYCFSNAS